jgi:hypothetical protein
MKGAGEYIVVAGVSATLEAHGPVARDGRLPSVASVVELT